MNPSFHVSTLLICACVLSACARPPSPAQAQALSGPPQGQAPGVPAGAGNAGNSAKAFFGKTASPIPGSKGELRMDGRAFVLSLRTPACDDDAPMLCEGDNTLSIADKAGRQVDRLKIASVVVNSQYPLFEGALDRAAFVNQGQSVILGDIDSDGVIDLAVRTGSEAGYGGASYAVYLFDPQQKKFVLNRQLGQLTEDPYLGMFRVEAGRIRVGAKSGCCNSEDSLYEIVDGTPRLVKQATTDASVETGVVTVTTRTLLDGEAPADVVHAEGQTVSVSDNPRALAGFSVYASTPTGDNKRCVAGAQLDQDGMRQKPAIYISGAGGRAIWSRTLPLPANAYQSRATHCLRANGRVYALLQSDTQPQQSLSQTLLRIVRLNASDGTTQASADVVVPGVTDAYSAWVGEGRDNFRWQNGTLVVSGQYFRLADAEQRKPFEVSLREDLVP